MASTETVQAEAATRPETSELVGMALRLARSGHPVFPVHSIDSDGNCTCGNRQCRSPGKHPITEHGLQDATTDPEQITRWWKEDPLANVGMRCDGLLVLDVDPRSGGEESFYRLQEKCGRLPETTEQTTGSGGKHLIFKLPENANDLHDSVPDYDGLDIRSGSRHYIIVAPSWHEDGKRYRWSSEPIQPSAESPEWLISLITKDSGTNGQPGPRMEVPELISDGERNTTLYRLACKYRADRHSRDEILAIIDMMNRSRCNPPLESDEVKGIVENAMKHPPGHSLPAQPATRNGSPGDGKGASSVSEVMRDSGLDSLTTDSSDGEREAALRCLSEFVPSFDRIGKEILRDAAKRKLKELRVSSPAGMVDAALNGKEAEEKASTDNQGQSIILSEPEPWPEPVNGAMLLNDLRAFISRFVVLPKTGDIATVLWVIHTYILEVVYITPILAITSPVKQCGKSTTQDVLSRLVLRPMLSSNLTAPVVFRAVDELHPTLLIDEIDSFLESSEALHGVLNSGHRKSTAVVTRLVGDDYKVQMFSTWGAKSLAGIKKLPDTLEDRSIVLEMRRKSPTETVEPFCPEKVADESERLRQMTRRWVDDNLAALGDADVKRLPELGDRANDNWKPLLSIADTAGGNWPTRAREAAMMLSGKSEDSFVGIQLLEDIRTLIQEQNKGEFTSQELVDYLVTLEDRPWPERRNGKPITKIGIARLLSPFEIKPKQFKVANKNQRGYLVEQFKDAFHRYLPPIPPIESGQSGLSSDSVGFGDISSRYPSGTSPDSNNASNPDGYCKVPTGPTEKGVSKDIGEEEPSSMPPEEDETETFLA